MDENAVKTIKTTRFSVFGQPAYSPPPLLSPQEVYNAIFQDVPASHGLKISLAERKAKGDPHLKGQSFIYGEFDQCVSIHLLLRAVLSLSDKKTQLSFCDLGSGTGKISIAAALFPDNNIDSNVFRICYGIELMESLYQESLNATNTLATIDAEYRDRISFLYGDFLAPDHVSVWTNCDLVVANSTCFDKILMEDMAQYAATMRHGSVFVTLSKSLPVIAGFVVIEELRLPTSWGMADFFLQRKEDR